MKIRWSGIAVIVGLVSAWGTRWFYEVVGFERVDAMPAWIFGVITGAAMWELFGQN